MRENKDTENADDDKVRMCVRGCVTVCGHASVYVSIIHQ
jgi:hypothetical protein